MDNSSLNPSVVSFIGLAGEYCSAMEDIVETERPDFIDTMLRLLPRIYITATGMDIKEDDEMYTNISQMDETAYEQTRGAIAALMGEDDTYLETFEEDMKYSETPIAASISESLADIYQDLYDFTATVRLSEGALINQALAYCMENFRNYWSQTLVNVMRPLNHLKYMN